MNNYIQKLKDTIGNCPQCLERASMLQGLLSDAFPKEKLKNNLLIAAYQAGATSELSKSGKPDINALNRMQDKLIADTGITEDNAYWAIKTWAIVLGKMPVSKYQDLSDSDIYDDGDNLPQNINKPTTPPPRYPSNNSIQNELMEVFEANVGFMPTNIWYQLDNGYDGMSLIALTNLSNVKKKMIMKNICQKHYTEDNLVFVLVNSDFSQGWALTTTGICIGDTYGKEESRYADLNFHVGPDGMLQAQGAAPYYNELHIPWDMQLPGLAQYLQMAQNYVS